MSAVRDWMRAKLEAFAFAEASSRSLGLIRILVALNLFNEFGVQMALHRIDGRPEVIVLAWLLLAANFFVMVGYKTRWATLVWCLCWGVLHLYFGRWLGEVPVLQNTVQAFQCIVVLTIAPCGRSLSIDRALEVRSARAEGRDPTPETTPAWVYDLLLLIIAVIYLWAAHDKTDPAWLHGERMEMYFIRWYGSSESLSIWPWVHPAMVAAAWSTTIVEFMLAFGLVFRRTRAWVVVLGFMLHLGIAMTLAVSYFSFKMMVMLFAAVPPQRVHELIGAVLGEPPAGQDSG